MNLLHIVSLAALAALAGVWYLIQILAEVRERGILGIVQDIYAGRKRVTTRPVKVSRGKKRGRKNRTHA